MVSLIRAVLVLAKIGGDAVEIARSWLGTPYRHQASVKGAGADCLGLIRGVWRGLYGAEPEAAPAYTADWTEVSRDEQLWRAADKWLTRAEGASPGDVLLFRMARTAPAKHLAIRSGMTPDRIIHAYSGRSVIESPLTGAWRRRIVATFRFPEREV